MKEVAGSKYEMWVHEERGSVMRVYVGSGPREIGWQELMLGRTILRQSISSMCRSRTTGVGRKLGGIVALKEQSLLILVSLQRIPPFFFSLLFPTDQLKTCMRARSSQAQIACDPLPQV